MTDPQASVKYNTRKFNTGGMLEVRILSLFSSIHAIKYPPIEESACTFCPLLSGKLQDIIYSDHTGDE